jgi:mono/diheme cytochrome c family protein
MTLGLGGNALIPLAAADNRVTTAIIVSVAIVAFFGFLVVTAVGGPRTRKAEVPAGFRPGPADADLEGRVLDRWISQAMVAMFFMAAFLPVYWLREPTRLSLKENQFLKQSIERGELLFSPAGTSLTSVGCATCHGAAGVGGNSQFTIIDHTTGKPTPVAYAEPPLRLAVARYTAAGMQIDAIKQQLRDAIERGRPNTPMPTWGLSFGGPLNSQAVDDVLNYILSIQVSVAPLEKDLTGAQIFAANCAICHSAGQEGLSGTGIIGPNLTIEFQRNTQQQIHDIIKKGRANLDRPSMPAWGHLGEDAINALVAFIKSIQGS